MFIRPALITFITAGDPHPKATLDFMLSLERYVNVIELGIPFSDPMADGETIQRANVRALKAGTKIEDVFNIIREFREHSDKPIVLMTYYNPVYRMGVEKFIKRAKDSGSSGMIVVDLPLEESREYLKICNRYGMGTIFLAAPNTSDDRLKAIDEASSFFVYLISLYGTTGARDQIPETAFNLLRRAKRACRKPLAVGFGVSSPDHVASLIGEGADGIVVGSALISIIEELGWEASEELVKKVKELRKGLTGGKD